MTHFLEREKTAVLVVDVQEGLLPQVENCGVVLSNIVKVVLGAQALAVSVEVAELRLEELGGTVGPLREIIGAEKKSRVRSSFSCAKELPAAETWVLVGLEAHVSILQTAKELRAQKRNVVVVNDAISSRSIYDFSTAIAELKELGVRITSSETLLFELVGGVDDPAYEEICSLTLGPAAVSGCGCC